MTRTHQKLLVRPQLQAQTDQDSPGSSPEVNVPLRPLEVRICLLYLLPLFQLPTRLSGGICSVEATRARRTTRRPKQRSRAGGLGRGGINQAWTGTSCCTSAEFGVPASARNPFVSFPLPLGASLCRSKQVLSKGWHRSFFFTCVAANQGDGFGVGGANN
jgi:hypothetical protein